MFRRFCRSDSIIVVLVTVLVIYVNCNYLERQKYWKRDIKLTENLPGFGAVHILQKNELDELENKLDGKLKFQAEQDIKQQIEEKSQEKLVKLKEQKRSLELKDYQDSIENIRQKNADILKVGVNVVQNIPQKVEENDSNTPCNEHCHLSKKLLEFDPNSKTSYNLRHCENYADKKTILDKLFEAKSLLREWDLVYYLMNQDATYDERHTTIGRLAGKGRQNTMTDDLLFSKDNQDFMENGFLKIWAFTIVC